MNTSKTPDKLFCVRRENQRENAYAHDNVVSLKLPGIIGLCFSSSLSLSMLCSLVAPRFQITNPHYLISERHKEKTTPFGYILNVEYFDYRYEKGIAMKSLFLFFTEFLSICNDKPLKNMHKRGNTTKIRYCKVIKQNCEFYQGNSFISISKVKDIYQKSNSVTRDRV